MSHNRPSNIAIYRHPHTQQWVMDASGPFGGGFAGARIMSTGHAHTLIRRYNTNPAGCFVYVEPGHPDADVLSRMGTAQ